MKRSRTIVIIAGLCLVLLLGLLSFMAACTEPEPDTTTPAGTPEPTPSAESPDEVIEFTYITSGTGPTLQYEEVWAKWVAEVEERAAGKVKLNVFYSGQLCPIPESYNSVVSGLADIAQHYPGLTPGRFTCLESIQIPMLDTLPGRISVISWECYEAFPEFQAQFSDTKPLAFYCTSIPYQGVLATVDKPIRTLEDMKGLKVSASGTWPGLTIEALGAAPMQQGSHDIYMNLEKKVLDGARIDPEMLTNMKLQEIVKYVTLVNTGYVPFWFVMNLDKWNSLPPDVQKVFEDTGGAWVGDIYDDYTERQGKLAREGAARDYGVEIIELSDEELARWVEVTKPIQQIYIDEMEADGLPGQALVDMTLELMEKYRFTGYDE